MLIDTVRITMGYAHGCRMTGKNHALHSCRSMIQRTKSRIELELLNENTHLDPTLVHKLLAMLRHA